MTIPEFLKKLKATKGPWVLKHYNIRLGVGGACPICAVANNKQHKVSWWAVHRGLGLGIRNARAIALAADMGVDHNPILREQLLAATVNR